MKKTLITLSILAACCLAQAQRDYYYAPTYSAQNNASPNYYTYAPAYYPQQGYVPPGSAPPPDPYSETTTTAPVKRFGIGITLGEPAVGADIKYWLNDTMAIDGAAGLSSHSHSTLYMHADVLWHKFDLFDISPAPGKLPLYFGVGGLVRLRDHGAKDVLGVRVPIGVDYIFDNVPIDIFAELGPALDVHPVFKGEITGGIGARFWF